MAAAKKKRGAVAGPGGLNAPRSYHKPPGQRAARVFADHDVEIASLLASGGRVGPHRGVHGYARIWQWAQRGSELPPKAREEAKAALTEKVQHRRGVIAGEYGSTIVKELARDGEPYARALELAEMFLTMAAWLPREAKLAELTPRQREYVTMIDIAWRATHATKKGERDKLERAEIIALISRLAAKPAAVAAARASGNALFLSLLERWPVVLGGRTGAAKWKLLADWYVTVGGTAWSAKAWENTSTSMPAGARRWDGFRMAWATMNPPDSSKAK